MAFISIKKKVERSADKLGIAEPVIAACTTNPSGTMKRMLSRELGGITGAAVAGLTEATTDAETGLASGYSNGQNFMVLTRQRLIVTSASVMSGKPEEIVAEWLRGQVVDIQVDSGTISAPLTIAFADSTAVQVEGAKGTDPASLATALSS
ncbi:MAG: hypothetical protein GY713_17580 [Actinomycetia bacterium]|nr:hypothetical protein [Actinomycetes bacterium]